MESTWQVKAQNWALAYGAPVIRARFKSQPQDFKVVEVLTLDFSDAGEHVWLRLRKTRLSTEDLASRIARLAGVPRMDVSFSGLKDVFAITEQWFSIRLAGKPEPNWNRLESDQVQVLEIRRHDRKLKRGTHCGNAFEITLRDAEVDSDKLSAMVAQVREHGVPNYFGEQRFGRQFANIERAKLFFNKEIKLKRSQRSIIISSARSWLFNQALSSRVGDQSWNKLHLGEPAMFSGSGSYFNAEAKDINDSRLQSGDLSPSCPLWGVVNDGEVQKFRELYERERQIASQDQFLLDGLLDYKLKYQRRATRCMPQNLSFDSIDSQLTLKFGLAPGQYATSVLRELVQIL